MKLKNSLLQHCIVKGRGVVEHITKRDRAQNITRRYRCAPTDPNSSAHCVMCSHDERKTQRANETSNHVRMGIIKKSAARASRRYAAAVLALRRARDMAPTTEPCEVVKRQCQLWTGTITCWPRAHEAGFGGMRTQMRRRARAPSLERGESSISKLTPANMRNLGRRRLRACQVGA